MRSSDHCAGRLFLTVWAGTLAIATALAGVARADDLGVIGPVYPIAERDLLASIEQKLRAKERSGELAAIKRQATERAIKTIEEPKPVTGIGKAQKARTYYYDPSVVTPYAITDDVGRVLIPAGTPVNPLDTVSLSRQLFFFDARDPQQVSQAKELIDRHAGKVKLIVTGGSYMNLMRRWKLAVYYDQEGVLIRKLGVHAVPALVSQEGKRLRIDELPLS
jgi:conjugal transfer pilus assembly protein TraW